MLLILPPLVLGFMVLALMAALLMYARYLTKPWTRDAYVRANVVGVAPRVVPQLMRINRQQISTKLSSSEY